MVEPNLLFVYGTLRKGYGNHRLLSGCPLIGVGTVKGVMYAAGIPYLTPGDGDVVGEVYEVTNPIQWEHLDGLEGHPRWYRREVTDTTLQSGEVIKAWAYFMPNPRGEVVPSGDFNVYSRGEA